MNPIDLLSGAAFAVVILGCALQAEREERWLYFLVGGLALGVAVLLALTQARTSCSPAVWLLGVSAWMGMAALFIGFGRQRVDESLFGHDELR